MRTGFSTSFRALNKKFFSEKYSRFPHSVAFAGWQKAIAHAANKNTAFHHWAIPILYAKLLARIVGNKFRMQNCSRGLSGTNFVCKIACAGCRERISYAKLLARVVGNKFRMQNCLRGLSGTNFVCKIACAGCRERISYAKLLARIVGNEFRTQNCSRGLSGTNFG